MFIEYLAMLKDLHLTSDKKMLEDLEKKYNDETDVEIDSLRRGLY